MGKTYEEISPELSTWIGRQHVFFVSTAPAAIDGHINCSPKGLDSFRILGPRSVAYLDLTGSGAETIAHIRENGRVVFLFCAFAGPPKIVRLYGRGEIILPGSPQWEVLRALFPMHPGARAIIQCHLTRISDSCGFGVPQYSYKNERATLPQWAESKGTDGLAAYQKEKNLLSIDGLPALEGE